MHEGKIVCSKGKYKIIECLSCGFKHAYPIPSEREIKEYYKNYNKSRYYQKLKTKLSLTAEEKKELCWSKLWYEERLLVFNKYVRSKNKRLLDIGCGRGYFSEFMNKNGWKVSCLEPSIDASRHACSLGLEVFNGTIEEFMNKANRSKFNAINLINVLEHTRDPIRILKICKTVLKPSGIISIDVPNDFNILQLQAAHRLGNPKWWVDIPEHINYFNFDSLEKLLRRFGFEVILKTTDFPMELFLLMGKNYVGNDKVGSKCQEMRVDFEFNITADLKRKLYETMAKLSIGRTCIMYARLKK